MPILFWASELPGLRNKACSLTGICRVFSGLVKRKAKLLTGLRSPVFGVRNMQYPCCKAEHEDAPNLQLLKVLLLFRSVRKRPPVGFQKAFRSEYAQNTGASINL